MKLEKSTKDRVSLHYKGVSVFATGTLAKVIAYSLAGLVILIGVSVIQNARLSK